MLTKVMVAPSLVQLTRSYKGMQTSCKVITLHMSTSLSTFGSYDSLQTPLGMFYDWPTTFSTMSHAHCTSSIAWCVVWSSSIPKMPSSWLWVGASMTTFGWIVGSLVNPCANIFAICTLSSIFWLAFHHVGCFTSQAHSSSDSSRSPSPLHIRYSGCFPCFIRCVWIVVNDIRCLQPLHLLQGQTIVDHPYLWTISCFWCHNFSSHIWILVGCSGKDKTCWGIDYSRTILALGTYICFYNIKIHVLSTIHKHDIGMHVVT